MFREYPRILWAQRDSMLYVKLVTPEVIENSIEVGLNDTHLNFTANSFEKQWEVSIPFFRRLEADLCNWEAGRGHVQFILTKKWVWRYWPRLQRDVKGSGELWPHIGVDWKRWKAEDESKAEQNSVPEEDDWLDEDYALTKKAHFPFEEYPDDYMPLLNRSSLQPWLEGQKVGVVLFFSRESRVNMLAHALFASVSKMLHDMEIPLGRVDKGVDTDLMKMLHITNFPSAQIFLATGETFLFDTSKFKRGRELVNFLYRQMQPEFTALENYTELDAFMKNHSRVALGVFDESGPRPKAVAKKAASFDHTTRGFRARVDMVPLAFARVNMSLWSMEDRAAIADRYKKSLPFTGYVMEKTGEDTQFFKGKWKQNIMAGWTYNAQFNLLELITPGNFDEFRNRRLPITYLLMDDDHVYNKQLLDEVKTFAKSYYNKMTFVYTPMSGPSAQDLRTHLRCEYNGATSAVIEDHINEYMYCATTEYGKPITFERVEKLVNSYMTKSINPDKVRSEQVPLPFHNPGPLYKVVSDNMFEVAMAANRDVVLHFYTDTDELYEDRLHELEKFAELAEDAKHIYVGKIDGFKNEKPQDFPDLGYFPCTWMFPMYDKYSPRHFNSSAGFTAERLLRWVHQTASFPLPEHAIPADPLNKKEGSPVGWNGPRPDVENMEETIKKHQAQLQDPEYVNSKDFVFKDEL